MLLYKPARSKKQTMFVRYRWYLAREGRYKVRQLRAVQKELINNGILSFSLFQSFLHSTALLQWQAKQKTNMQRKISGVR
mmetsp:Transcript_5891/g.11142  ORF Transcript_5891/g.11142 Transcript_5891/m.11142 type:complete len:80 (+) Transcript_5891:84-323(+)